MKSAYELAMERLDKEDPNVSKPLSDAQKEALKAIDTRYDAQKAERRVFLEQQIAQARTGGDHQALQQVERQLADEMTRIEEEKEAEKEKVRSP